MPREKNVEYDDVALCKICQSKERTYIELLRYNLKRTFRQMCEYLNRNYKFWGLEAPLNVANCSVHFARHVSEKSFWEEYARYMKEETNCKVIRSAKGWQQWWANLKT
jgi:hypothetical protein